MKGVVFKEFEEFVRLSFGDELFETVLDSTELESQPPFLGPTSYPDADLFALVGTTLQHVGVPLEDALQAFGQHLFDALIRGFPEAVDEHTDLRSFLQTVHSVIHVEVRKLLPGAETPEFAFEDLEDGKLRMQYRSRRKLCALARGLLDGAARSFGTELHATETHCMNDGHDCCEFVLTLAQGPPLQGARSPE